ncbi:4-hydroxyphenylpyruvate dioxygenase-like protein isoform X2 [Mastacembelus armatus]|uniref:4-hydroxyphenylpyruvate dioxygenase-like protein isoform X2 n=1 Tax=Mastacembelus armatus TaxID=205130 RepID=UPI000E46339C|nr:4-hydroxyphenylpyruvate dioxygenase-like protein isoform X2 [Mastacembelus armatus]
MAAYLSRLHHISLHVSNVEKLANDLVSKFKFHLFAARLTDKSRQLAFKKGTAVFVVNERPNQRSLNGELQGFTDKYSPDPQQVIVSKYNQDSSEKCLYDISPHYSVDTVSNVCFEVEDVDRSSEALRHLGCDVLVPPTTVQDDSGLVTYSVVKSIVGNVCHTLIDRRKYDGIFLPGFNVTVKDCNVEDEDLSCPITHFDHITYVCPRKTTHQVIRWYEKLFGFQRFFIDSNEDVDEGFVINQEGIGLRLTAMEYWKCSTAGIILPSVNKKDPDCKFVIAESLPEQGRNQVDTFLEQHQAPGIQHIGLYTNNIVSTAHVMAEAGGKTAGNRRGRTQPSDAGTAWYSPGHRPAPRSFIRDIIQRKQKIPSPGVYQAHFCRGHLFPGADRAKRGVRFRRGEHPGAVEVGAGVHG